MDYYIILHITKIEPLVSREVDFFQHEQDSIHPGKRRMWSSLVC